MKRREFLKNSSIVGLSVATSLDRPVKARPMAYETVTQHLHERPKLAEQLD